MHDYVSIPRPNDDCFLDAIHGMHLLRRLVLVFVLATPVQPVVSRSVELHELHM